MYKAGRSSVKDSRVENSHIKLAPTVVMGSQLQSQHCQTVKTKTYIE